MRPSKEVIVLIAIAAAALAIRLLFALSTPEFTPESYFLYRQVEKIQSNGLPFFFDQLNHGITDVMYNPGFGYILALFAQFTGTYLALKIIPSVLAVSLVFIMYALGVELTGDRRIGLFVGFLAAFIPVYFSQTILSPHALTITIPLSFLTTYFFIKTTKDEAYLRHFFWSAFVLILIDPTSWIWLFGFMIYFVICWLEHIRIKDWMRDAFLGLFFLGLVVTIITFGKGLSTHGLGILWQNIPLSERAASFTSFSFFQAVSLIGIIPFIAAFWV